MAAQSDTQRTAIRERKRQAQAALRQQLAAQERLQDAAFAALGKLAAQLQRSAELFIDDQGDALQRATAIGVIAGQLDALIADVQGSANDLVARANLNHAAVAALLGVRTATLFPRTRSERAAAARDAPSRGEPSAAS